MNTRIASLTVVIASLVLAACGEEAEPKYLVKDLTVLGVRAEPPEAAPGAVVHLDALVGDPKGEGRPVTHEWFFCEVDPVQGSTSCSDESRLSPLGVGASLDVAIPDDALAGLPPEMAAQGIDLFVAMRATAGDERTVIAAKRVHVSLSITPNANPALDAFDMPGAVLLSGGSLMVPAGSDLKVDASATDDSHQEYIGDLGEPVIEELKFAWFLTAGTVENEITWEDEAGDASSVWTAPKNADVVTTLWVVMRDGRGGIDWRTMVVETID